MSPEYDATLFIIHTIAIKWLYDEGSTDRRTCMHIVPIQDSWTNENHVINCREEVKQLDPSE